MSQSPPWTLSRIVLAITTTAIVVAALLSFVMVKSAQMQAGYRVHDLRMELATLRAQIDSLEVEYGSLSRPARLARIAVEELSLQPTASQPPSTARGSP
jgi:cell division protein FtsL